MAIASKIYGSKTTAGGGSLASNRYSTSKSSSDKPTISTKEGLADYARSKGFEKEADELIKKPKLSVLQRLGRGLSAFETGNALYQKRYEDASFLKTYAGDIAKGIGSAITGKDYQITPKNTYKDILTKEGMKDRPGKIDAVDVVGLAADIISDPTTFFGGAIGKGVIKTVKKGNELIQKAPVIGKGVTAVEDTLEGMFVPYAKLKKTKEGAKYVDEINEHFKATRAAQNDFMEEIANRAKVVKKQVGAKEFERLKRISGEAVETGGKTGNNLFDELLDAIKDKQKGYAKQLKERGVINASMENYMHHAITPEAAELIGKGADVTGFLRPLTRGTSVSKTRKIQGTVKEINEEFNKKFGVTHGLFDEDALNAFAKSGVQSIKELQIYDLKKRIATQFGKQNWNKAGLAETVDEVGVKWVKANVKGMEDVLLPKAIADDFNKTIEVVSSDESMNNFLRFYDKAQNIWKSSVTGWFPSFHTRNFIGGAFNNFIGGVTNPDRYRQAAKVLSGGKGEIITKGGIKISYEQIRQMAKEYGVVGQTGIMDVVDNLRRKVDPGFSAKIGDLPQKIMGRVENGVRVPMFLDALMKSSAKTLDDAAIEASKKVVKYHFDYMPEGMTAFEKTVMKRLIPFYTFTRNNIPLQIEQMIMQPGKYAGIMKTQRALGNQPSSEDEEVMPRWMKERFTIKAEGGYWTGVGFPMEEATEKLANPLRGLGISLSPFVKTPVERLTGYNIFKERKIDEDLYGSHYRNAPDAIKKLLQMKERTSKDGVKYYTVNPERKYWLELIGARGLSTALRVMNGIADDDRKELMSVITTIKKYDYTMDELRKWSDKEAMDKLEAELLKAGELAEYTNTYIPKNDTTK